MAPDPDIGDDPITYGFNFIPLLTFPLFLPGDLGAFLPHALQVRRARYLSLEHLVPVA